MTTKTDDAPSEAFEDWASEEGINNFHFHHCWAAWQAALASVGLPNVAYQQYLDETKDATRPYARRALVAAIAECQALSYDEYRGITVSEAESIGGVLHELRRLQNIEEEAVAIVTTSGQTEAVRTPKVPVPTDVMEARAQGRAEALAILLGLDAESGLDEYCYGYSIGDTGDYGAGWDEDKLRLLFRADDSAWSLLQETEDEYWHNLGLREETERNHARSAASAEAQPVVRVTVDSDRVVSICEAHGIGLPVDCVEMVVEIIRLAASSAAVQEWQPIETAPRDGTRFLGCTDKGVDFFHWQAKGVVGVDAPVGWRDGFITVYKEGEGPKLWMPSPAAPASSAGNHEVADKPMTLPTLNEGEEFVCDSGCGTTTPELRDFEYSREELNNGQVISKTEKVWRSRCCGACVIVYGNLDDSWTDLDDYIAAHAAVPASSAGDREMGS